MENVKIGLIILIIYYHFLRTNAILNIMVIQSLYFIAQQVLIYVMNGLNAGENSLF